MTRVVNAAATFSQSGSLALQGAQAALGLSWWATHSDVDIELRDDTSSTSTARRAYRSWMDADVDILLGPYGSNLVRAVIPVVAGSGRLLWNHGGSADDLAHPMVVPLPAPASTYLTGNRSRLEWSLVISGDLGDLDGVSAIRPGMAAISSRWYPRWSPYSTRHGFLIVEQKPLSRVDRARGCDGTVPCLPVLVTLQDWLTVPE